MDADSPILGLKSLKEIAEYPDVNSPIQVPSLQWLGEKNQEAAHEYLEALLPTNIPLFKRGNKLYSMRENCLATMIKYYRDIKREYGYTCVVTTKMQEIARKIKLSDLTLP